MRSQKRVAILIKTNLKYDGRVIAEVDTLSASFTSSEFKIFLLPNDNHEHLEFRDNVSIEVINIFTRKSRFKKYLLPVTTMLYTLICLWKLFRYKPDVIHVHDSFPLPIAFLYTSLRPIKLIYDDHELFKTQPDIFHKGLYWFEGMVMKKSTVVFVANNHRKRIIRWINKVSESKIVVLENYNHKRYNKTSDFKDQSFLDEIMKRRENGEIFLLHQGQVSNGRGIKYMAELAKFVPAHVRIIFMGITDSRYQSVVNEFIALKNTSENIGFKPYEHINAYWAVMDGGLIFYDTEEINNRYCAPNRLYLAFSNKIPLLVNEENPVLNSSIKENQAGLSLNFNNTKEVLDRYLSSIKQGDFYPDDSKDFSFKQNSAPTLIHTYEQFIYG